MNHVAGDPSPQLATALLQLVGDYVFVGRVEPDGGFVTEWSNRPLESLTGGRRENGGVDAPWETSVHPEDRETVRRHYRQAARGETVTCEFRFVTSSGSARWVRSHLHPVRDEDPYVRRVHGVMQSLTETAAVEASIRSREHLLRDVLEALPIGVWFVGRDRRVQDVNQAGQRMSGGATHVGPEQYRELNVRWVETGEPISPENSAVTRALEHGQVTIDSEVEFDLPDGTHRVVLTSVLPIRDADGTITGVICLSNDITARKRLEEQVQQSQRMDSIGRMAGGIAHDFNNLLTIIIGCAEMALRFDSAGGPTPEWEATLAAARRAAELTSQLLAFARQQPVAPRTVDLNATVGHMEGLLRRVIGEDIRLVVQAHPAPLRVNVDPGQFEQILLNLAVNARDAMPGGGTLRVETTPHMVTGKEARHHPGLEPGPKVLLTVTDTGVGIPQAIRARVFEPFFTTKSPGSGTGLGLAMCYGIVKQAGGHIDVESSEGAGATFSIYLPEVTGEIPVEAPATPAAAAATHARILLVEDEPAVAELTRRALEFGGYRVTVAHNGTEALGLAGAMQSPVDLLLTDVVMPDMRGTALAKRLLERDPGLRVMFVSGYPGSLEPDFSTARLLHKPYKPSDLLRHVADALRS